MIGRPSASGIDHFDLFKTISQCGQNPFMRKRKLSYRFLRKFIVIPFLVFKYFNIPFEYSPSAAIDFYDDQIAVKLPRPSRGVRESPELAESVNVKNKQSIIIEMQRDLTKDFLPFAEAEEVIEGIEHTDNHVKLLCDTEAGHALSVKTDMRQLLAGQREHLLGSIEPRDFIGIGKKTQNGASTASDLEDGLSLRLVASNEAASKVRRF